MSKPDDNLSRAMVRFNLEAPSQLTTFAILTDQQDPNLFHLHMEETSDSLLPNPLQQALCPGKASREPRVGWSRIIRTESHCSTLLR